MVQFSLLNGSIHDSWLQQHHEGMPMDEEMRAKCEVLARVHGPNPTDPNRKKSDRSSVVRHSLKHQDCTPCLCLMTKALSLVSMQ